MKNKIERSLCKIESFLKEACMLNIASYFEPFIE